MARGHGRQNGREKVDEGMDVEVTDGGGSDGDSGVDRLSLMDASICAATIHPACGEYNWIVLQRVKLWINWM